MGQQIAVAEVCVAAIYSFLQRHARVLLRVLIWPLGDQWGVQGGESVSEWIGVLRFSQGCFVLVHIRYAASDTFR